MFVGEVIRPAAGSYDPAALARGDVGLPRSFGWREEDLTVATVLRSWRSSKTDRGDAYRDREWYEFATGDGRVAVVYFDRHAKRPADRWRLYTLSAGEERSATGAEGRNDARE